MSANGSTVEDADRDRAAGVYSYAQRALDRVAAPSSRRRAYDSASALASSRPVLFSFAASQLLLSFLPLLLFVVFSASTVAVALGAAILFALFWIGVAFLLLVPALLVTSSVAVLVWAWAVGSFLVARWLYAHAPVGFTGAAQIEIDVVKDEHGAGGKVNNAK
ncbi:Uncharacterized protein TPAR_08255 [Tolypocladium paradoxum]|uniref:Uncharacterized protein n=1 Tax=Tolypocladium paradoxum TaxID=94208 RepID=A0A2S4KMX2_9HYPO|nr:Uncharacterized protein TPAR_08255 [Tolypocladium paradoxum]